MMQALGVLKPIITAAGRGKLSILIYHRVLREPDPIFPGEVDARRFATQLEWLSRVFRIVPLLDAIQELRAGKLPPRTACITFDDGYADNFEVALPILKQYRTCATFFVSTGFLNGGRMWNDSVIEAVRASGTTLDLRSLSMGSYDLSTMIARRQAIGRLLAALKYLPQSERTEQVEKICAIVGQPLPNNLMMRSEQVRDLHAAGMGIGGHTVTHPILTRLDPTAARWEVETGREFLQSIIGKRVDLFAYPNGKPGEDYGAEHVALVRELGFEAAVSTAWGAASADDDLFQLPRFTPWDKSPLRFTLRMATNLLKGAPQYAPS
jgi:peptidoglycan/xylan/chitin deacetylase (PgdA/CDA1 family)